MKETRGNLIVGRARMNGLDVKRAASRAGIKLTTMYKRIRLPGTMTVDELTALDKAVKFTDDELLTIIRNR